jgi:TonB family protein
MEGFVMIARAHKPVLSPNRPVALAVVIGAHVAGVYVLSVNGFIRPLLEDPPALPMKAFFRDEVPDRPLIRSTTDSTGVRLRNDFVPLVRPPEMDLNDDVVTDPIVDSSLPIVTDRQPIVVDEPPVVSTPLSFRERRAPREFYPAASLRMGEEGIAAIRVCVDAAGRVQGVPAVTSGSGHARLDAAAVTWARESLQFRAATENGVPVASCKAFRVTFTITP